MRGVIGLIALAGLVACSSSEGGTSSIVKAAVEKLRGGEEPAGTTVPQGTAPARSGLTREAIVKSGRAMVRGRLVDENARSVLSGVSQNGPYVTYGSRFGQFLTLRGTLVTASRGAGFDLLSVATTGDDPLVSARPVESWPASIKRTYRHPGRGPEGRPTTVVCTYVPGEEREIEIVEITHSGRQVEEVCRGNGVAFTNVHFADHETGFVWRSLQWLGPEQGFIDLEVLEPFTG